MNEPYDDEVSPLWIRAKDKRGNEFEILNPERFKIYKPARGPFAGKEVVRRPPPRRVQQFDYEKQKEDVGF